MPQQPPTLFCDPRGGLGNQLFQIFTTLSFAIDTSSHYTFISTPRDFNPLSYYTIRESFFKTGLFYKFATDKVFIESVMTEEMSSSSSSIDAIKKVDEKGGEFGFIERIDTNTRSFLSEGTSVLLEGYFQDPKYFSKNFERIAVDILGIDKAIEKGRRYIDDFEETTTPITTVSLHFRIGDYKKFSYFHPILPTKYYVDSLNYVIEMSSSSTTSVFKVYCFYEEEDTDLVKNMIEEIKRSIKPSVKVDFLLADDEQSSKQKEEDWEQMLRMSTYDHHIIANSSFSWWGAYIGDKFTRGSSSEKKKVICYPSLWFADSSNLDVSGLFKSDDPLNRWCCITC